VEGDCLFVTNIAAATADATESQDADDRSHMAGSAHLVSGHAQGDMPRCIGNHRHNRSIYPRIATGGICEELVGGISLR
jgi:hypothetical protein